MFKKLLLICLIALPQASFANDETYTEVSPATKKLLNTLIPALIHSPVVIGVDIAGMNTRGEADATGKETCVRVFANTGEAVAALKIIYPQGVMIDGAYVCVEFSERFKAL